MINNIKSWLKKDGKIFLEDIIEEIKSAKFYLDKKFFIRLIHDNNYNMGYIFNFKK